MKQTHIAYGIHFLSFRKGNGAFFFLPRVSLLASEKTDFPQRANNLKAPVWDKFVQNTDIFSSQAVESVQP